MTTVGDLQPGDKFLLEVTVSHALPDSYTRCTITDKLGGAYLKKTTPVHSVLPREIKVGDTVSWGGNGEFLVLCIDGNLAFFKPTTSGEHYTASLSKLKRIK